jgi:hypothetical protein
VSTKLSLYLLSTRERRLLLGRKHVGLEDGSKLDDTLRRMQRWVRLTNLHSRTYEPEQRRYRPATWAYVSVGSSR